MKIDGVTPEPGERHFFGPSIGPERNGVYVVTQVPDPVPPCDGSASCRRHPGAGAPHWTEIREGREFVRPMQTAMTAITEMPTFTDPACSRHFFKGHRWWCRGCDRETASQFREVCEVYWQVFPIVDGVRARWNDNLTASTAERFGALAACDEIREQVGR